LISIVVHFEHIRAYQTGLSGIKFRILAGSGVCTSNLT